MKKYYISLEGKQEGPFSIEELKDKKLNQESLIWFEGLETWQKAGSLEELNSLFKATPPPIPSEKKVVAPPIPQVQNNKPKSKGSKKVLFIILGLLVIVTIVVIVFYQQQQQLETQNTKIAEQELIEKQRHIQMQQQLETQNAKIAEQELIEKQRRDAEILNALNMALEEAMENVRKGYAELERIKEFKLLRTESEKANEIAQQLEIISSWEAEVDEIQRKIKNYK